jgi:pimeloyl-ACP methyl ester carboxylesterase
LDFFSFTTPSFIGQGTIVATMTPTSADHALDAGIQLQSSNGIVLADRDVGFDNVPETLVFTQAMPNTTYFVVCRSADFSSFGSGDYALQIGLTLPRPNLAPFQPPGWSDKIVVSKGAGSNSDSPNLTSTNTLYVDWAVLNSGSGPTTNSFTVALYVDGALKDVWPVDPPFNADFYVSAEDYVIGALSVGNHVIKLSADPDGGVLESNEGDNEYTKTITVIDDDPNDQLAGAVVLGAINSTTTNAGTIGAPTDVDVFAFSVVAGQRVSFDIDQTSGLDSYLRLFNSIGVELALNNDAAGPGETNTTNSYLEYTFTSSGTYFLGVSGFGNTNYNLLTGSGDSLGSTGAYTFVVSPGLAGTIRKPGITDDYPVDLLSFGAIPAGINTNQRTWIVTHGWNSSRSESNIFAVADALYQTRPGDQVLTLDWSAAADTGYLNPFSAEAAIVPVAQWAASALIRYGFSGTNLNLVGHSFGSYVSDEIARRIPGGVNTIVTLDPAVDIVGGYDPTGGEVDFARDSLFSWSFHSSSLGNDFTPTTADESFIVDSGLESVPAHSAVVFLFSYFLLNPDDPISRYFLAPLLLAATSGPWVPDQYASFFAGDVGVRGYEGIITTTADGRAPTGIDYVPLPRLLVERTTNGISISWKSLSTNFVLQTSATAGQSALWTNVPTSPLAIGQTNIISMSASDSMRLFRLLKP